MFIKNSKYKILTPNGMEDFYGIQKVVKDGGVQLTFENNTEIITSLKHCLSIKGKFIQAEDIDVGDVLDGKKPLTVINKDILYGAIELYDIVNSGKNHVYMTNGIISHNCKFIGSSDTLIDAKFLEGMLWSDNFKETADERVKKFKEPIKDHIYVAGTDVGEGIGKDGSIVNIFDVTDPVKIEQVAIYWSNTTITQDFQNHVYDWASYYNNAWIMHEENAIGDGVANHLWYDCEYENMVHYGHTKLGIKSNRKIKVSAALHMKYLVESGQVIINDKVTISELSTFIDYGNNVYKAEEDCHDDTTTAMMWALYITHKDIAEQVDLKEISTGDNPDAEDGDLPDQDEPLGIFNSGAISNLEADLESISTTTFNKIFGK